MIHFASNIKPNYTDIIRTSDVGFDACSFVIKKENISNAGFIFRNTDLAKKELAEKNKEMLFVSLGLLDETDLSKQDIENASKIAEKLGCVFTLSANYKPLVAKKSILLKNTKKMDAESIIKNILSHDFDLALDISALYLGSKKFLYDLDLILGTYMDRIKIIFFSDASKTETNISIGDGNIDVKQTIAILEKYDYKRAIVIDINKDSQKNGMDLLKKITTIKDDKKLPIKAVFFDADKTLYSIDTYDAYDLMYDYISKKEGTTKNKLKKMHKNEIEKIKNNDKPILRKHTYCIEKIA
ncbi:MAG: hypothetical protein KAS12_02900, partial [Candidatus Aenigmarchaeota archaeon]|nr:hypothetical protein [Candidatus Aenigmarchaeota archaeon]